MPGIHLLYQKTSYVWQRNDQGYTEVALPGETLQNRWKPEGDVIAAGGRAEITEREQHYIPLAKRLPNSDGPSWLLCSLLLFQLAGNPRALVFLKPAGLLGPVRQIEKRNRLNTTAGIPSRINNQRQPLIPTYIQHDVQIKNSLESAIQEVQPDEDGRLLSGEKIIKTYTVALGRGGLPCKQT